MEELVEEELLEQCLFRRLLARRLHEGKTSISSTKYLARQLLSNKTMVYSASLAEVSRVASLVSSGLVSVGASLSHVHVPGRAFVPDDFDKGDDIELGMGIHNEEGFKRLNTDLPGLVKHMLAQLLDPNDVDRAYVDIRPAQPVVLLINNLGAVSVLELGYITEEICLQLGSSYSLQPARILAGTFMSSLNGLGFSISILKLADTGLASGVSMLELLDDTTESIGWMAAVQPATWTGNVEDRRFSAEEDDIEALPTSKLSCKCS